MTDSPAGADRPAPESSEPDSVTERAKRWTQDVRRAELDQAKQALARDEIDTDEFFRRLVAIEKKYKYLP